MRQMLMVYKLRFARFSVNNHIVASSLPMEKQAKFADYSLYVILAGSSVVNCAFSQSVIRIVWNSAESMANLHPHSTRPW